MRASVHDVAIVGGGLVGATLACALGRAGLRVAVVEGRAAPAAAPGPEVFDLRVSTLTLSSIRILERVGAWEHMQHERVTPIREMFVWEHSGASIGFDAADIGEPALGYIAENTITTAALERASADLQNVHWYRPATLEQMDVTAQGVSLRLDGGASNGTRVTARLVVGADGARSRVRQLAELGERFKSFEQSAVVATVRTSVAHRCCAWQRFLPTGPLAFLPLPQDRCSIVWSTASDHADALLEMTPAAFGASLAEAFEHKLGEVTLEGERAAFELSDMRAASYVAERVALVGDAAHTVHPLAGQGVNLGLLDAASLAQVVQHHHARGRDFGLASNLRRYERWRRGQNHQAADVLSGFHHLFATRAAPVRLARGLGLGLVDRIAPLKRVIMRRASGLEGDLPDLARADLASC
ncbi:MAG: UbiH/UbiF/VisC/COQ6 family ubiquinone biosynthesis hydroxylase [Gammaproteobacteria bacterium]